MSYGLRVDVLTTHNSQLSTNHYRLHTYCFAPALYDLCKCILRNHGIGYAKLLVKKLDAFFYTQPNYVAMYMVVITKGLLEVFV